MNRRSLRVPLSHAAVWVEVVRLLAALSCVATYCALAFGGWLLALGQ